MAEYVISGYTPANVYTRSSGNELGRTDIGFAGETSSAEYRVLYKSSAVLPEELLSSNYIIASLRITFYFAQDDYSTYPCTLRVRAAKELGTSYTANELYEACTEGTAMPDRITLEGNTTGADRNITSEVCCTDPVINRKIIENGFALDPIVAGVNFGSADVKVNGVYVEVIYYPVVNYMIAFDLAPASGEIQIASQPIELSWKITAYYEDSELSISTYPTHFDVEYSGNSGESWDRLCGNQAVDKRGDTYFYRIAENTLNRGTVLWRVRPYMDGIASPNYAGGMFYVRVQASTSSVTCDGKPLPTISWTSSAQIAYQIRFADYDSGACYGTATSFTIPYFYADGYYPVQVRTQASDGTWSAWTELEYVQITNTPPPDTVTLTAVPTRHAVVLNWTDSGTSETFIVYRDHVPVYVGTDTTFTDITANGECTYYVRAIQSKDYSQSNSMTVNACPKTDCLYDFASMQWIPLKYSLQERSRNYSNSADVVYKNYAGRAKPVAFSSGHTVRQMSGSYVFKTRAEALRLRNTVGHTVIFKDTRGGTIIGILNDPVITVQRKLYAVTFLVTETDYTEEREYAPE